MNRYIKGRISKGEFVSQLFKQRVESIGGTYEANDCLVNTINSLTDREFKDAKLILTPNGYLVDKLPTIKPNGGGDATVTRNTTKTRINSSGLIESNAANVLAPDYLNGVCPSLNVEGQRTNYIGYTETFAGWLKVQAGTATITATENFTTLGDLSVTRLVSSGSGESYSDNYSEFLFSNINNTGVNFGWYSFWLKSNTGVNQQVGALVDQGNPMLNSEGLASLKITATTEWKKVWFKRNAGVENSVSIGCRTVPDIDVLVTGFQFEEGATGPTSNIRNNAGGNKTRSADTVTIPIPAGTTEIIEKYKDGTTNTITTIPASPYTVPTGKRYEYILMK